jgi:hypothetical protein
MSQKWESLSVIRSSPPAYGVCRAETCRAKIEWVTTVAKGAKIPVNLPLDISRVYERQDGSFVTVIDQSAVHWTTCTESRERVAEARRVEAARKA